MCTSMTSHLKLIIFDCDGVLVDSEPLANHIFWSHLNKLGWPLSEADTQKVFIGRSLDACAKIAEDILEQPLPKGFMDTMQTATMMAFKQHLEPMPHIRTLCHTLRSANINWVVASSGSHEKMTTNLTSTGLIDLFPHRYSSTDVVHGKPAPDLFLLAARSHGTAANNCLVIEDSPAGLEAAANAKMDAIFFNSNKLHPSQPFLDAFSSIGQIDKYFRDNLEI